MISALPSSLHSHTLALICSRTSDLISPVSPENRARKPCVRLLMTSISWRDTVWTTSFLFCSSPSGHCTNCVCKDNTQRGHGPHKATLLCVDLKKNKKTTAAVKSHWRIVPEYLSSHGIIVSGSGEGAAQLADLPSGLVDGNNISDSKHRGRRCRLLMAVHKDPNA